MNTDTRPRKFSDRLDREWTRLNRRPAVLATVRSWGLTDHPFESLDDFLGLTGFGLTGFDTADGTPEADALLGRLVAVARTEPLACRIVLQRLLPGLLAIARDEQARDPRTDAFEALAGEVWLAIVEYRVEARPTHIAARLLNDARHRAFVSKRRPRVVEEIPHDEAELVDVIDITVTAPFDELVGVLSEARRRGLSDRGLCTVRQFVQHGSAANVATAEKLTNRAVRYQQRHAVTEIRRLVAA